MIIRLQKIKKINAAEVLSLGLLFAIVTSGVITAYDGIYKNLEQLKKTALHLFAWFFITTAYCLIKLNDAGRLGKIYHNAKAKVEAEEVKNNITEESVVVENNSHKKSIERPLKAMQRQYRKPKPKSKPTIGILERLKNYFRSKKTSVDATSLVDDNVEVENITSPESSESKSREQKHHHARRRHKQPKTTNSSSCHSREGGNLLRVDPAGACPREGGDGDDIGGRYPICATTPLKKTSTSIQSESESESESENEKLPSSSTTQILELTSRKSESNNNVNKNENENENKESFSSSASAEQLSSLVSSSNNDKCENTTTPANNNTPPSVEPVLSEPLQQPDVSSISSAVNEDLVEKMKAILPSVIEQASDLQQPNASENQKHEDKNQGNRAELSKVLNNLLLQSEHLATMAALNDPLNKHPKEVNGLCTAAGNFRDLCNKFIKACKDAGIEIPGLFNTPTPNPNFLPTRTI